MQFTQHEIKLHCFDMEYGALEHRTRPKLLYSVFRIVYVK